MAAVSSCCICKQALYSVYTAKKRNRIHHHSALDVCMSLIQVGFSAAIMRLRNMRTWHLKGIKFCEFLNIQRCRRPFNQSTPSQFCVVARTNFAVSVAQTLTVRALILQAIRPCASVWVWLRETNYKQRATRYSYMNHVM